MGSLIIIRGPLGIGKTTIAKNLAKLLKARYFSVDEILSKNNLDHINEEIGCVPENNFMKVNKIIFSKIKSSNKSIIVDGNFYYQNQIKDLINKIPLKYFAFTLFAPIEVCILRDSQRSNSYGKDAVVVVYNLVSRFDYGQIINTSSLTIEEIIKTILSKIDN